MKRGKAIAVGVVAVVIVLVFVIGSRLSFSDKHSGDMSRTF